MFALSGWFVLTVPKEQSSCSSWRKTLPAAVFPVLWQCLPVCCFWAGISDGIRRRGRCFKKSSHFRGKRLPLLICIFMGAQLIYSLFGNMLEFLLRLCGYTAMGQLNAASAQSTTVSMFLYTAVFAPVGEELIYRGLVMRQFQKYGNVFAIVVSAALFGVMHANLFQMIFAFLTGLVLGYTAAEFSLRWSIVLHLINNLVFGELLGWLMGYLSPAAQDYLYRGINIFFFAFAAFWLLHHREQLGHYLQKNRCAKKCYAAAFTAVAMVTFFVGNFGLAISGIQKL